MSDKDVGHLRTNEPNILQERCPQMMRNCKISGPQMMCGPNMSDKDVGHLRTNEPNILQDISSDIYVRQRWTKDSCYHWTKDHWTKYLERSKIFGHKCPTTRYLDQKIEDCKKYRRYFNIARIEYYLQSKARLKISCKKDRRSSDILQICPTKMSDIFEPMNHWTKYLRSSDINVRQRWTKRSKIARNIVDISIMQDANIILCPMLDRR